jgi:Domain of unknown function (DUF4783)
MLSKTVFVLQFSMLSFTIVPLLAQNVSENILETTRIAISSGSTHELGQLFHSNFELHLFGKEYSKQQSAIALKDFFSQNPPKDFSLIHKGTSEDKSLSYSIGQYQSGEKNFRVLLRFKNSSQGSELYKLEFREIEGP